jgi:hypothetical protein
VSRDQIAVSIKTDSDGGAVSGAERGASWWTRHAAASDDWDQQHEAEWARVDRKLRGLGVRRGALDAEEANLLRYAEELKLWRGFGYASLLEYLERALGYAPHTAAERVRVARSLAALPLLADALERGELAHSAVRELSRVAVPDTEAVWFEAARGKCLREIESMVSGHRPGDLPTDETEPRLHRKTITLEISPETYDVWRRLHALAAEEHGQRLSDDELIPVLFRRAYGTRANNDGGGATGASGSPAYKIALKQCPDCRRAWQYTGGRDIEIDPAVLECAACDAVHLGSLAAATPERATTTVTPRKREQVLARDGHRCTVPGCRRIVGLDLHHIEYQRHGGGHELSNLTAICDLHHRAVHFQKLVIRGVAPDRLTFEFRKPRDRRNVTDDDPAPHATSVQPSPTPYTAPVQIDPAPHATSVQATPTPYTAPVQIDPAPHATSVQATPTPYTAPVQIDPAPHATSVQASPAPYTAPLQIDPLPHVARVQAESVPCTGRAVEAALHAVHASVEAAACSPAASMAGSPSAPLPRGGRASIDTEGLGIRTVPSSAGVAPIDSALRGTAGPIEQAPSVEAGGSEAGGGETGGGEAGGGERSDGVLERRHPVSEVHVGVE